MNLLPIHKTNEGNLLPIHGTNKGSAYYLLNLGLLSFWAVWFSLAFMTNFFDLLLTLNKLESTWLFHSGNYNLLAKIVSIYQLPKSFVIGLFIVDIAVQGLVAILFISSFIAWLVCSAARKQLVYLSFLISIALWAVFIILEEVFIAYAYEPIHINLMMFELLSLFSFRSWKYVDLTL